MARHAWATPVAGLRLLVVLAAVPHQLASHLFQGADEVEALHGTTSSSTLRAPGIAPADRSR
ncbi:MAG: hypothetical protein K2W96_24245 [Gemmataceae bacterium]|nr:hypothetical protein [Gemmataceae bacterium]